MNSRRLWKRGSERGREGARERAEKKEGAREEEVVEQREGDVGRRSGEREMLAGPSWA